MDSLQQEVGTAAGSVDVPDALLLLMAIERARENLLDLDTVVDDRRRDRTQAERAEAGAVAERDAAVRRLTNLLARFAP